ncbi:methyltransferase domain-containing protein [Micromonospora sp. NPDC049559]|uniref:class I SAM-dependent methyltransferase n=1 Tax=Micromonospora sp. NPDC049559 TaxID=3155923 RepID=UPI00342B9DE4
MTGAGRRALVPAPAGEVARPTAAFEADPEGYRTYFEDDFWRLSDYSCSAAGVIETELSFLSAYLDEWGVRRILDAGCGRGRHLVPLAAAGYEVTGVDISARNVELARAAVNRHDVKAEAVVADLRDVALDGPYDLALFMLSSFGYHSDADNVRLLRNVRRHLRIGGRLMLDQPNREQLVAGFLTRSWAEVGGHYYLMHYGLDLHAGARDSWLTVFHPEAGLRDYFHRLRLYTTAELRQVLREAGFALDLVLGDFSDPLTRGDLTSRRLQYVAHAV